jgi:hypothetical protein
MATSPTKRSSFPSSRGSEFGPVEKVFDDIWWAWGTVRFAPAATFPRNMTLVREGDHLVAVHPVMLPDVEQAKVDALGPVRELVRLGDFHGMDDGLYKARYGARLWGPKGLSGLTEPVADVEMDPGGATPFADADFYTFEVAKVPETVLHLKRHGGILLTCDSVQNWAARPGGCSFLGWMLAKAMGFSGAACIGPGWRKESEPKTGPDFGPRFRQLLDLDFRHFISAHGPPRIDTAKDDLRATIDRLYPR